MTSAKKLHDRQPAAADRIDYLDAAKGIFIIFIIMGHHLLGADSFVRYLYSMGVTPFFLITGFLCAYKNEWERYHSAVERSLLQSCVYRSGAGVQPEGNAHLYGIYIRL